MATECYRDFFSSRLNYLGGYKVTSDSRDNLLSFSGEQIKILSILLEDWCQQVIPYNIWLFEVITDFSELSVSFNPFSTKGCYIVNILAYVENLYYDNHVFNNTLQMF